MPENDDDLVVAMYRRVRRKPVEDTASAAILVHSQACGLVAYVFDVHPDAVDRAVVERALAGTAEQQCVIVHCPVCWGERTFDSAHDGPWYCLGQGYANSHAPAIMLPGPADKDR